MLYGAGGARVQALQRGHGGRFHVTGPTPLRPLGRDVHGATFLPLEVVGPDHASVRACAVEIDARYAEYLASCQPKAAADVAASAPRA